MKTYKEYLTESKKSYEFKVKIAGEQKKEYCEGIKKALAQFKVESCSTGKSIPIQETQIDFPEKKNVGVTIYDVNLSYPATGPQIREMVANQLGLTPCCVKVYNLKEEQECELNHQYDTISHEPLLGSDYPTSSYPDLVTGDKHTANFLKELSKTKHELEQYKGVNDQLLANSVPGTTSGPASEKIKQNNVNILSKTNNPDPRTK